MAWFAIYQVSDGALVSETETRPVNLRPQYAYQEFALWPGPAVIWDPVTLTYIERPAGAPDVDLAAVIMAHALMPANLNANQRAAIQAAIAAVLDFYGLRFQ